MDRNDHLKQVVKSLPKISPHLCKKQDKFLKKRAFALFVHSRRTGQIAAEPSWLCCGQSYAVGALNELHQHIALSHEEELDVLSKTLIACWEEQACSHYKQGAENGAMVRPQCCKNEGEYYWLPSYDKSTENKVDDGRVLLFYKYKIIKEPEDVCNWQRALCTRLGLRGKIRIGCEGINGTVAGHPRATDTYMKAFLQHPSFSEMTMHDFKSSPGCITDFDDLRVGVYKEIVPMGISPTDVSYTETGKHLTPQEFHVALEQKSTVPDSDGRDYVLVDCRNFYESRIGKFKHAVTPDIRKFSYWPEYVDKNLDMFSGKDVYMYCTGGIRCERGSAYLKQKGICKNIYQLQGGIHRYMEEFPDGLFRGKLFVFDNRYTIKSNDDVIADCTYCGRPWDKYSPCSSIHCHQLVLSCDRCRQEHHLTACCNECQAKGDAGEETEQCSCTRRRTRIPREL